ncbi:MAG: ATP-binding cassette domain-containing protein [Prevotella sp.]|jgi:cell division transport system ATP-binding protein|nr:ATP-binding cassette domain-containing protein [Prevotella sp.]
MLISYKKANIYQRHGIRVLKDVNFQVEEGQFVYIIGRVGSGKTSLLRTLYFELDMEEADEAKVFDYDLLNLRQKDIPGLRRQMGVVFQDFQLLGDRTVYKNLQFVLKATGWKKKDEIDQRINEVLSDVGLQDKIEKMPHELSGGEQQRVAIARAILNKPKLIIADEPTGNLDPETAEDITKLLRKICQTGTAVVMSTHNMPLLDKYPGVVFRCAGGKMEEVTSDFNQIQLVDEPDTDEIIVRYSEREEI